MTRVQRLLTTFLLALGAGSPCPTLPDTQFLSERYTTQSARFAGAWGALSAARSVAIVAELKRQAGDHDLLDKQIALKQEIVGSPLVVSNRLSLLQDGPATYRAMFAAIAQATDHINIKSYIIEGGAIGLLFADALLERQASGVQVNVIYDSVGALHSDQAFFERLRLAGINVLEFNPVNPLLVKKPWTLNHRDHRKLCN